jgi:hypothetical protein
MHSSAKCKEKISTIILVLEGFVEWLDFPIFAEKWKEC